MPLYDYHCFNCEEHRSNVHNVLFGPPPVCCNIGMEIVPAIFTTGGILFGDEIDLEEQMDLTFRTNAEYEQWKRDNPDKKIATQSEWKQHYISSKEKADVTARKRGFRNHDEFMAAMRAGDFRGSTRRHNDV